MMHNVLFGVKNPLLVFIFGSRILGIGHSRPFLPQKMKISTSDPLLSNSGVECKYK
jgi:hypothetical protein